ncbi:hypothetical protein [Dyella acidiphila]|uniref:Chitinase n=1 Tax=Dyella acidiphila TaxID=2775866 RepID=A0ABR9G8F8_9GAMM|nr:hypothetical protein [Dyella acidiphila]MBE1160306.1 hypothetical protein [Dyella acidiphila]
MLISYPILPSGADATDEDAQLKHFLDTYVDSATGFYPISFEDRWHGGIHLKPGKEALHAIADGEVVCYRVAAQAENYPGLGDYDTSFVLLKHSTESGENTPVVFYSLLMHLKGRSKLSADEQKLLPDWLRTASASDTVQQPAKAQKVWRKDVLGFSGVYGGEERVHFEIFATDTDLGTFWKDSSALAKGANGSADFFGNAGFIIPAGKSFQANHPHAQAIHGLLAAPTEKPVAGNNNDASTPAPTVTPPSGSLAPAGTQGQIQSGDLYVSVHLARGTRTATTYRKLPSGKFEQVGQPVIQASYEYQLHQLASKLYKDCPSAGYEWLRFGRVLGTDTTQTNENWELIRYASDKTGYIDLASDDITKLSDADFPYWLGWQKIGQAQAVDPVSGICDVPKLLELLHGTTPPATPPSMADEQKDFIAHATAQGVADQLRYLVVQHPSEWDDSDLETRFAKERQPGKDLANNDGQDTSWNNFKTHASKLAFWSKTGLDRSVWHFHPAQFVAQYKQCKWLSLDEISQLLPRTFFTYSAQKGSDAMKRTQGSIGYATSSGRFSPYRINLNKTFLKYGITTATRMAHLFAQVYTETDVVRTVKEYGEGKKNKKGKWPAPAMEYYTVFYGRGIMQLTWASNYEDYGTYRNFPSNTGAYVDDRLTQTSEHYWSNPKKKDGTLDSKLLKQWAPRYDPDKVASDNYSACDSGGFYWVSKYVGSKNYNINRNCDAALSTDTIGRVSVLVNGGGNGYFERQGFARYAYSVISDEIKSGSEEISASHGKKTASVKVDYTPQRP